MWTIFGASFFVLALLLYIPGYLVLRTFNIARIISFAAAPLITASAYSLEAILFARLDIFSNWAVITLPVALIGAVGCIVRLITRRASKSNPVTFRLDLSGGHCALFIVVGIVACALLYLLPTTTPDAFICGNDIVHHISLNSSILESGNWSTIESTTEPGVGGSFYPSLWSLLSALPMSAIGTNSVVAMHATNAVIISLIFPLSLYLLAAKVFENQPLAICMTAVLAFAFFGFPWELFLRKTLLYPNALGFALMPGFLACFMLCFCKDLTQNERIRIIILAFAGMIALCLAHPNTLFTAVVFCFAFLLHKTTSHTNRTLTKLLAATIITLTFAGIWVGLSFAPFMESVVSNPYNAGTSTFLIGGLVRIALLKSPHLGMQILLALLVVIGLFSLMRKGEKHWLALPFTIMALLYALNISLEPGTIKSILTGFWYNHPTRVFSSATLYAIPLAALGARFLIVCACKIINRFSRKTDACTNSIATAAHAKHSQANYDLEPGSSAMKTIIAAAITLALYVLPIPLPSSMTSVDLFKEMKALYDPNGETAFFTQEERDFMKKVSQTVPQGSRILNMPNDGSAFAYALYGVNVTGRDFYNSDTCISVQGAQIVSELGSNTSAAQQLKEMGIDYVLVLDTPLDGKQTIYKNRYDDKQWAGMLKLTSNSPGLTLVLEDKGMALYEVTPSKSK